MSAMATDRPAILAALAALTAAAWAYLVYDSQTMSCARWMAGGTLWSFPGFLLMLAMWSIMMAAMMIPSAAPMILTFATVSSRRRQRGAPYVSTAIFVAGYLAVWAAFSVLATAAQFALQSAHLLTMTLTSNSARLTAALLIVAGLFQWTPWKRACLSHCAGPLGFLAASWREGRFGALKMGAHHGFYCLGCCWAVMALLFAAGVMNLLWVAALSAFVLVEKIAPKYVSRGGGLAMIAAGSAWLVL